MTRSTVLRRVSLAGLLIAGMLLLGAAITCVPAIGSADLAINRWVAGWRPGWLTDASRAATLFGSLYTLAPLAVASLIGLALARSPRWWSPAASLALAAVLYPQFKLLFSRPRPPVDVAVEQVSFFGYPSGHASQSSAFWIALGVAIAAGLVVRGRPIAARRVVVAGVVIAGVIGLTRIVLGVHSPTDVLGGWMLGTGCVLLVSPRLGGRAGDAGARTGQRDGDAGSGQSGGDGGAEQDRGRPGGGEEPPAADGP